MERIWPLPVGNGGVWAEPAAAQLPLLISHERLCGFHSQHLGQTFSPGVAGCAASMSDARSQEISRLGRGI